MDPIFRCNGEYFGFLHTWRLFDSRGYYLGWVDEGEVWGADGAFLGELVNGCYVLRRKGPLGAHACRRHRRLPGRSGSRGRAGRTP